MSKVNFFAEKWQKDSSFKYLRKFKKVIESSNLDYFEVPLLSAIFLSPVLSFSCSLRFRSDCQSYSTKILIYYCTSWIELNWLILIWVFVFFHLTHMVYTYNYNWIQIYFCLMSDLIHRSPNFKRRFYWMKNRRLSELSHHVSKVYPILD